MTTNQSEVARLREQLALEEQSSRLGLYGPAIVATHASITARMERGAERIFALLEQGKQKEAEALLNTEYWEGNDDAPSTSTEASPRV